MQAENKNRQDLFDLLSKWSNLLPVHGVQNASALDDLHQVGKEIQQLCSQVEQIHPLPAQIKAEPSSLPEQDFKPSFVFQLKTDELINPKLAQFESVFDFCEQLQNYCTSSSKLVIEKDWLKLLLACSSNNYERFMWIHLTFQSANNLKLDWPQVKKRLMCKFDTPTRFATVLNAINSFKYLPEIENIQLANARFARLAEEAQIDVTDAYLLGLPAPVRDVISSTIDYDATTSFHCDLKDVQQRATVFVSANEGDFIFYSKTAHAALSLEHEKVNKKDCEFHLLAEHSTSNCPDFVIVKYPYMSFSCLPGVPKIHSTTAITKSIQAPPQPPPVVENVVTESFSQQHLPQQHLPQQHLPQQHLPQQPLPQQPLPQQPLPQQPLPQHTLPRQTLPQHTLPQQTLPQQTLPQQTLPQQTLSHQSLSKQTSQQQPLPQVQVVQPYVLPLTMQNLPPYDVKQEPPVEDQANRLISEAIAAAAIRNEEISRLSTLEIVELAKRLQLSGQPYPEALKSRVIQLKEEMLNPRQVSPTPSLRRSRRSESPPYRSSSSRRRSSSPSQRRYRDRSSSRSPSLENGCYVHGRNAMHSTKNCKQAQMVISSFPSTSAGRRSASPPIRRKPNKPLNGEENICIFCKLPFKPGHLAYCKEVRSKKKIVRRRP